MREPLLKYVRRLGRPFFTTRDLCLISGRSPSAAVQALRHLVAHGLIKKIRRGLWADPSAGPVNPLALIPFLLSGRQVYLSFVSALHLHGIISQIPQEITVASMAHTRIIRTPMGVYAVHRLSPDFFFGFDWYKDAGAFLTASPEKALLDCLYLAARKKKQFGHFPEMDFPASFSFRKTRLYAQKIRDPRLRSAVLKRLESIIP